MILKDYWRVDMDTAAGNIAEYLDLPYSERGRIHHALCKQGYIIVKPIKRVKPNLLLRLTIPLFFVFALLMLLFMPIRYFLTGDAKYSDKGIIGKPYKKWANKLNF